MGNKTLKIYLFIFIALLLAMMVNDYTQPKPIDWSPSFLSSRKTPYGAYILHKELPNLLNNSKVRDVHISPYEFFSQNYQFMEEQKSTYFFLNNYLSSDKESSIDLLDYVKNGNTVFMASHSFPKYLEDTLHFEVQNNYEVKTEIILELANKNISRTKYNYSKGVEEVYFNKLDTVSTTVLGYNKMLNAENKYINFVKIKYGDGNFILNTQPYAFTNYHLLKSNHAVYIADALSYVPDNTMLWDDRNKAQTDEIKSELRFILSKPALKYAWFSMLVAIFLFMIFRAKRRQRIIPIIEKLPNTSISFAKTIGNLYYQEGKPDDIIHKKITFFLEYLRNTYLLDTQNLNADFKKRLHHKTGIDKDEINRLIDYIVNLSNTSDLNENSLLVLNKLLNKFYKKTKL